MDEQIASQQAKARQAALILVSAVVISMVAWMVVFFTMGPGLGAVIVGFLLLCADAAAVGMVWYVTQR